MAKHFKTHKMTVEFDIPADANLDAIQLEMSVEEAVLADLRFQSIDDDGVQAYHEGTDDD